MSSGPKPFSSRPHGGVGGGLWPGRRTIRVDHARAISLLVPFPTSRGFGLAHQLSPCECSFHHQAATAQVVRGG